MVQHSALENAARGSLMRHFRVSGAPGALPGRVTGGPTARVLVACCGPAQRLATTEPRALASAVDVAVITLRANENLHRAATAVVEPVGRLLQQPQAPLPTALDSAGG